MIRILCFSIMYLTLAACSSSGGGGGGMNECPAAGLPGSNSGACLRDKVPGFTRLWQERARVSSTTPSRVKINDDGQQHGVRVMQAAQTFSFGPIDPVILSITRFDENGVPSSLVSSDLVDAGRDIISISLDNAFSSRLFTPLEELVSQDVAAVAVAGNDGDFSQPDIVRYGASGLALIVTGLDRTGRRRALRATACGIGRRYCVAAPYFFDFVESNGQIDQRFGTSFSTPIVSASLASARALWPAMTSRQTIELAFFCARPVNADGSLAPWGTILTEEEADNDLGQGVFSVECLFNERGALRNPITDEVIAGGLSLRGTASSFRLTDQFGRTSLLSKSSGAAFVPIVPDHVSGFFATPDGVMGFIWSEHIALALSQEANGFFGSYGTGDFTFGDTYAIIARLGHQWSLSKQADIGFHVQSVFGQMTRASGSLVRKAEGHTHQITAKMNYRLGKMKASFSLTRAFGVRGEIDIAGPDNLSLNLSLKPKPETIASFKLTSNF